MRQLIPIPIIAIALAITTSAAHAGIPEPMPRCGGSNALVAMRRATAVARVIIMRIDATQLEVKVGEEIVGTVPVKIDVPRRDSCLVTSKVGDSVIIAVESGRLLGSPFEDIVRTADVRAPLVTEFAKARTAEDRAKVLVKTVLAGGANSELAARFLASSTDDALAALTSQQLEAMRKVAIKRPERWLAVVLARMRIELGDRQYDLADLEPDAMARHIASILDFETTTDTDALADMIAKEPDPIRRWAAFERCDRVHKVALDAGFWTAGGNQRTYQPSFLSDMCRRGSRPPLPPPPRPSSPPPAPAPKSTPTPAKPPLGHQLDI